MSMTIWLGGCGSFGQDISDAVSSLMPPKPRDAAEWMFDPYDADLRRKGTLLISNSPFGGVDIYVSAYRDKVLHEDDPLALAVAIRALARHGGVEDAPLIADALEHENVQVRWEAAKGLQRIHNPEVVPLLLDTLQTKTVQQVLQGEETDDEDVRVEAAIALGQYPEDRVFQGLVAALESRELAVNQAAAESLHVLTGQTFAYDARPWLDWYNEAEDPFAHRLDYLYPTYVRKQSWWERLVFWTSPVREHPASPSGLRPASERRTYPDSLEIEQGIGQEAEG